ncbi:MAG: nitrilase-related carbon-nitrogen hydrolase, partial [Pseudomonadota bacterium]
MPRLLNVACLQTRPQPNMPSALEEAYPLAEAAIANGAQMLFLPEYCGGLKTDGPAVRPPFATEENHDFLKGMQDLARENNVWINLGSIAVDGPDGKVINRGIMLDDTGRIRGRY